MGVGQFGAVFSNYKAVNFQQNFKRHFSGTEMPFSHSSQVTSILLLMYVVVATFKAKEAKIPHVRAL